MVVRGARANCVGDVQPGDDDRARHSFTGPEQDAYKQPGDDIGEDHSPPPISTIDANAVSTTQIPAITRNSTTIPKYRNII